MAKTLTTAVPTLNLDEIARFGLGATIAITWMDGASDEVLGEAEAGFNRKLGVFTLAGELTPGGRTQETFPIALTANGVGRGRMLISCNECRETVARIYFHKKYWACLKCHNLAYPTQSQSHNRRKYNAYINILDEYVESAHRREWLSTKLKRETKLKALHARFGGQQLITKTSSTFTSPRNPARTDCDHFDTSLRFTLGS